MFISFTYDILWMNAFLSTKWCYAFHIFTFSISKFAILSCTLAYTVKYILNDIMGQGAWSFGPISLAKLKWSLDRMSEIFKQAGIISGSFLKSINLQSHKM